MIKAGVNRLRAPCFTRLDPHLEAMIEISWGKPLTLVVTENGGTQKISTIEQAKYWLRKRWPVVDDARLRALGAIESAMECMLPVQAARAAFKDAARSAGYRTVEPT